jgi:hypothetical protein
MYLVTYILEYTLFLEFLCIFCDTTMSANVKALLPRVLLSTTSDALQDHLAPGTLRHLGGHSVAWK